LFQSGILRINNLLLLVIESNSTNRQYQPLSSHIVEAIQTNSIIAISDTLAKGLRIGA